MKKLYVCLCSLAVLVALAQSTPAFADYGHGATLSQPSATQPGAEAKEAKTFTGQIVQSEGKYVLVESSNNAMFQLDDQERAKQFEGKNVKVTGTLDTATNVIHVTDIQAA
jgi:hypothetical protein